MDPINRNTIEVAGIRRIVKEAHEMLFTIGPLDALSIIVNTLRAGQLMEEVATNTV